MFSCLNLRSFTTVSKFSVCVSRVVYNVCINHTIILGIMYRKDLDFEYKKKYWGCINESENKTRAGNSSNYLFIFRIEVT